MSRSRYVAAYHLILTTYGFWLPNDPRGSWSDFVRSWELFRFGAATKIDSTRSVAHRSHDRSLRALAKGALARPPVVFTGEQARAVARGFAEYVARSGCVVLACSILPEHVHLVIARHSYKIEQISNLLKGAATTRLTQEGLHPFAATPYRNGTLPTPWARKDWDVFLAEEDLPRAIRYVEDNPLKAGKKRQQWAFVTAVE